MRIAHTDPSEYHPSIHSNGGAGTIRYAALWGPYGGRATELGAVAPPERANAFETDWQFIHRGVIPPGCSIGHHAHYASEEMYVVLEGAARLTHNGHTAEFTGGATFPCRLGDSHGMYNPSDRPVEFMVLAVRGPGVTPASESLDDDLVKASVGPPDPIPFQRLDRALLSPYGEPSHGGKGEILVRRLWSQKDFKTAWRFSYHAVVPPDCSVGYHRHDTIEECYIILDGTGRMTVDGETEEVVTGDAIPNWLGGSHGLYNPTDESLEILVSAVCLEKGRSDSTDLNDDLSQR